MEEQSTQQTGDISSRTILVLVVLVVVFSFIGAWVNINQALSSPPPRAVDDVSSRQGTAEVGFVIQGPPKSVDSTNTGMVALGIRE
ncbi:TPA: hypothetical protein HA251_07250 [Candidatus Woesearchaeota archaeon]|nr:hypothetical protein [Candidatus Woesearchaeota archaeon]